MMIAKYAKKKETRMIANIMNNFYNNNIHNNCYNNNNNKYKIMMRYISKKISRRKILNHPKEVVFKTVADVDQYDQFLPYCTKSELVENSMIINDDNNNNNNNNNNLTFEADLSFAHSQISETIRHKIVTIENESVISTAAETGFWNSLVYDWKFSQLPDNKTEVEVKLDVDIKGLPYAIAFDMLSDTVLQKVFDAFVSRVHGYDFINTTEDEKRQQQQEKEIKF